MTPDVLRQIAERLVGNCWDVYLGGPQANARDWQAIVDAILLDGRAVAKAWLEEHPSDEEDA